MRFLVITLLLVATLSGCRKSDRNNDTDTTLIEDVANAQNALFEAFFAAHEANLTTPGIRTFLSCAVLTADTLGTPRSLIVDFSSPGCPSPTGRNRSGKLIIYQNGYYSTPGSTSTVYFDAFYVNGCNYSSTFTIVTTSTGYYLKPNSLKITAPDSSYFYTLSGNYALTWTTGAATITADDDEFSVTGTMNISGRSGGTGVCTIVTGASLTVKALCGQVVSGQMTIEPNGLAERNLDFGSGACDAVATGTLHGDAVAINITF
ncbi:MAG TPA: hypothetical protein VD905_09870 [Flavobacteriales bacterium]|nr:hypothetical protein [Flavobacteriales bacterium]